MDVIGAQRAPIREPAPASPKVRQFPNLLAELTWRTPARLWHGLIAEVLLQRTRARNVVPVYAKFIARFPEAENLRTATLEEIESLIYPLGLRWRAPLLKQLCDHLAATNGQVPGKYEELLKLPAVGPYVAAAMLSFHCGKRGVLIDANVVRWLCRLVDRPMNGETRRNKWIIDLAQDITPRQQVHEFNYALLDFTMEICAKVPQCAQCPVGPKLCLYGRKVLFSEKTHWFDDQSTASSSNLLRDKGAARA